MIAKKRCVIEAVNKEAMNKEAMCRKRKKKRLSSLVLAHREITVKPM